MEHLLYPNLDFEYELAATPPYQPPRWFSAMHKRWSTILRLLPTCHNATLLHDLKTPPSPDGLHTPTDGEETPPEVDGQPAPRQLFTWGVTPRTIAFAQAHQLAHPAPPIEVVREVNQKLFSHTLARSLGAALPHSCIVSSLDELAQTIAACPFAWVAKHPFGVSGRERILGHKGEFLPPAQTWAKRQLRQGTQLLFEPWLQDKQEVSFHAEILPDQSVRWLGHCGQLFDGTGTFRGNRIAPLPPDFGPLQETFDQAVNAVAKHGYFGPISIDAAIGTLGDQRHAHPLMELNARVSFGRLTLALQDHAPPGWSLAWWHPSQKRRTSLPPHAPPMHPDITQAGLYQLPAHIDPHGASNTFALLAPSPQHLQTLEASLIP